MKQRLMLKFILVFLITHIFTFAENQQPRFYQLPLDKGISLNLTYDMIQDSRGFLWFGTMYGLVKYDGENYTTYKYSPDDENSISFNDIVSVCEDSKGNLWIGTWGGGLNKFNPQTKIFTRYTHNPEKPNSIAGNIIWSICEDKDGMIWVGTGAGGLQILDPNSNEIKNINLKLDDSTNVLPSIQALFADENSVWIGHSKGVSNFSLRTTNIRYFDLFEENKNSNRNPQVNVIFKDSNKNLLLGTSNGLMHYDQFEQKFLPYDKKELQLNITSIAEDLNGNLWMGSNDGLIKLKSQSSNPEFFKSNDENYSILGNFVNKVLVDKSGIIWASSYNAGITKIILSPSKFHTLQSLDDETKSLSSNNIKTITKDNEGKIYIGTQGNKLNVFNPETKKISFINLPVPKQSVVRSIVTHNNTLWLAVNNNVINYDLKRNRTLKIPFTNDQQKVIESNIITSVCFDLNENLWIGTYNRGIYRFSFEDLSLQHFLPADEQELNHGNFILSIYADSRNNIWIGTYGGVYKFDSSTEGIVSFVQNEENPDGLSNNYVYAILEDSKGNYWFGTASGLNKFNSQTNTFSKFYQKDGLPSDVIFGIVEDNDEKIWFSTNKGISRCIPQNNSFLNFDSKDGLQGNVFNAGAILKSNDGTIYFGGMDGISYFNPSNLNFSGYNPAVEITSIQIKNNDGNYIETNMGNDILELEPEENSIHFEFASLDFTNPDKNQYQYKLFGYNKDWVALNHSNSVTFSRLPHGNYSFQLMGTNSDGIWSENYASLNFVIKPYFWQTWWFLPALILGVILISFLTHLLILKTKISRAVKIQKIKEEESERVRKQTARDFHDELGHRLTRISLLTEIVKRKIGITFSEISPLLDQISENSARLYDGTKDFIWAIDPKKDSLYELVVRLKDFGDEIFGSTDVNFNVQGLSDELLNTSLDMDWKRHLMLIFKEGMNNSLKHSNSNSVSLSSSIKADEFELILEDDGDGFEPDKNIKGNGLKNITKRAEILNAEVHINSKPGAGTKLSLKGKFPIKSVNFN